MKHYFLISQKFLPFINKNIGSVSTIVSKHIVTKNLGTVLSDVSTKRLGTITTGICLGYEIGTTLGVLPPISIDSSIILDVKAPSEEDMTILYVENDNKDIFSEPTRNLIEDEKSLAVDTKPKAERNLQFSNSNFDNRNISSLDVSIIKLKNISRTFQEENLQPSRIRRPSTTKIKELIDTSVKNSGSEADPRDTKISLSNAITKKLPLNQYTDPGSLYTHIISESPPITTHSQLHFTLKEANTLTHSLMKHQTFMFDEQKVREVLLSKVQNMHEYIENNSKFFNDNETEMLTRMMRFHLMIASDQIKFDGTDSLRISNSEKIPEITPQRPFKPIDNLDEDASVTERLSEKALIQNLIKKPDSLFDVHSTSNNRVPKPESLFDVHSTLNSVDKPSSRIILIDEKDYSLNDQEKNMLNIFKEELTVRPRVRSSKHIYVKEDPNISCNETTDDAFLIQRRMQKLILDLENDPNYKLQQIDKQIEMINKYEQELQDKLAFNQNILRTQVSENIKIAFSKLKEINFEYNKLEENAEKALATFKNAIKKNKYLLWGGLSVVTLTLCWFNRKHIYNFIKFCSSKIINSKLLKGMSKDDLFLDDKTLSVETIKENIIKESANVIKEGVNLIKESVNSKKDVQDIKMPADVALKLILQKSKIFRIK